MKAKKRITFLLLFLLIFHLILFGISNDEINFSNKYNLAKSLYAENKFYEATKLAKELISEEKYKFGAQFLIGLCLRKTSSNEEAINYFQNLIDDELNEENLKKLKLALARIYYSNNNFSEALKAYSNYIGFIRSENIGDAFLYEVGWCAIYAENYTLAEQCFDKIIEKKQKSKFYDKSKFSLAIVSAKQDNVDDAINIVEKRISDNENFSESLKEKETTFELYKEIAVAKENITDEDSLKIIEKREQELQFRLDEGNLILEKYFGEEFDSQEIIKLAILEEEIVSHAILLEKIKNLERKFLENGKFLCDKKADEKYSTNETVLLEADSTLQKNILTTDKTINSYDELKEQYLAEQKLIEFQIEKLITQKEQLAKKFEKEFSEEFLEEAETHFNKNFSQLGQKIDSNTELKNRYLEEQKLLEIQLEKLITQKEQLAKKFEKEFSEEFLEEAETHFNKNFSQLGQKIDSNTELKNRYLEEQKLLEIQLEKLYLQKEKLTNKIEKKFSETLVQNKKNIFEKHTILENNYSKIFENLKEKSINNPEMYEYLQEKEKLFELYKKVTIAKLKTADENSKKLLTKYERELKTQLGESNIVLAQHLGDAVDTQELVRLALLEDEIISHSVLLEDIKNLERQFAETDKKISLDKTELIDKLENFGKESTGSVKNLFSEMGKNLLSTEQLLTDAQLNLTKNISKLEENIKYNTSLKDTLEKNYQQEIANLEIQLSEKGKEISFQKVEREFTGTEQLLTDAQLNLTKNISKLEENIKYNTSLKDTLEKNYQQEMPNLKTQLAEKAKKISSQKAEEEFTSTDSLLNETQFSLITNIRKLEENIKSNSELKEEYQAKQVQIKSQLAELNKQKVQYAKMIEKKFDETLDENKEIISHGNSTLETNYQDLFVKLKNIVQQKTELSYFALSELLLEKQAVINSEFTSHTNELDSQQRYYQKLLEQYESE